VPGSRHGDPIDHILALDPGRRGIAGFFRPGGALSAARSLLGARRVLIVTGFVVAEGRPETDGPPGAAVLGRALRRLGAQVRYTSDPVVLPALEGSLVALGEPPDVFAYPEGPEAAATVLAREHPTHLVAIERPGRGRGGDYLNARGLSVAAWNRPLDEMFLLARRTAGRRRIASRAGTAGGPRRRVDRPDGAWQADRPGVAEPRPSKTAHLRPKPASRYPLQQKPSPTPITIGVGDGGNEIGMGSVRVRLAREGALIARIASMVAVDHLVVAGVSNWGAYGIVAQLGRLTGQRLLHAPTDERKMIDACVTAGAVDGLTKRPEPTVDALDADTHAAVVALLGLPWGDLPRAAARR
jgi:hypothetical protein